MDQFGIDIGYGYTKGAGTGGQVVLPSVIGRAENVRYQNELSADGDRLSRLTIGVDGVDHFVGELALQQSRLQLTPLDRSRTSTGQLRVLFLAALSQLASTTPESRRGNDVAVVTGLPVEYYDDRQLLVQQLNGQHRFRCNGYDRTITVRDVQVVPQPFGSLFHQILDDDGWIVNAQLARARVGIIDVGTYTTDYVLVDELAYVEKGSGSLSVALSTACDLLARQVSDHFGLDLNLHQADRCLRQRSIKVFGEPHDLGAFIDPILEGVAEEVVSHARTLWGEGRDLDAVLVTGGGGRTLGCYFQVFPHAQVVPDPVLANVLGFFKYAQRGQRGRRAERALAERGVPA